MKTLRYLSLLLFMMCMLPAVAQAQDNPRALIESLKKIHDITADFVLATAEMMDEDMYAYRPTVQVYTAGELLAHIANAQFGICSLAAGEENPAEGNYVEIATTRNAIHTAVKESFVYCEKVYAEMTDKKGEEIKEFFGGERRTDMTVSAILSFNSTHTYEHYGSLATYLRMNGMVPPSSQN
ncbi:MAG: DinB family protein [Bacteroidota bacterium]